MQRVQRAYLLDPTAPSPSVEMLLHAFVPHAFVDHTHANAVLSLIDQPSGAELAREVYGAPPGVRALPSAGVRPRQGSGRGVRREPQRRGPDPRQARHLHVRRQRARGLRAHDRDGHAGRGSGCSAGASGYSRAASLPLAGGRGWRGRADPARRLRVEGRQRRRRLAAAAPGVPQQRRHPRVRQRQGGGALCARRRDHAGPHHPHQGLAADRARAGGGQARRLQARGGQGGAGFRRGLPGLLRAQQRPRRWRQDHARSRCRA